MNIEIETEGLNAGAGLRRFVRRRVDFAFSTRSDQVERVRVCIANKESGDGNTGKSCQVQVWLPGLPDLVVENHEPNLYVAIHRAVDRAGWTTARKLERQRRKARARMLLEQPSPDRREPDRAA